MPPELSPWRRSWSIFLNFWKLIPLILGFVGHKSPSPSIPSSVGMTPGWAEGEPAVPWAQERVQMAFINI